MILVNSIHMGIGHEYIIVNYFYYYYHRRRCSGACMARVWQTESARLNEIAQARNVRNIQFEHELSREYSHLQPTVLHKSFREEKKVRQKL